MTDSHSREKDPILASLRIPSERRTKRDLLPIIEFVRGLKFFHSFSQYPHTVEAIASHLNLHSYYSSEIVFSEGDPGDLFYIILDGEITISKRKKLHSLIDFVTENVVLVKLGCGKYFGETALESQEGLRTATATASKPSNLLSLNRTAYQTILLELKLLLRGAVRRTLSAPSSIFRHISSENIDRLSELVVIRTFGLQEEIFSAGRKVNSLMVVKTGIVKLIKSVPKKDLDSTFEKEEARHTPKTGQFSSLSRPTSPMSLFSPTSPVETSRTPRLPLKSPTTSKSPRLDISTLKTKSPAAAATTTTKAASDNTNIIPTVSSPLPSETRSPLTQTPPPRSHRPGSSSVRLSQQSQQQQETPLGYWVLTRSEMYAESSRNRPRQGHDNASPGRNRMSTEEQIDFTVAVLMPGQVFGESALLDTEFPSPLSAVAATAVELYCFDSELLFALGVHRDEHIMRSLMDDWKFRNPPPAEILKQLRERYKWEKRKGVILRSLKPK